MRASRRASYSGAMALGSALRLALVIFLIAHLGCGTDDHSGATDSKSSEGDRAYLATLAERFPEARTLLEGAVRAPHVGRTGDRGELLLLTAGTSRGRIEIEVPARESNLLRIRTRGSGPRMLVRRRGALAGSPSDAEIEG